MERAVSKAMNALHCSPAMDRGTQVHGQDRGDLALRVRGQHLVGDRANDLVPIRIPRMRLV